MITACNCLKCGNPIEFEAEHSGAVVDCPHCGQNTMLGVPRQQHYATAPAPRRRWIDSGLLWAGVAFVILAVIASIKWMPETVGPFLFLLAVLFVYFAPTILAHKKRNSSAIFLLNLFLGWTFIGWVVALVWAATKDPEK